MKETIFIISANPYRIADEKTGEITNEGVSIAYAMTSDLAPKVEKSGLLGHRIVKGSVAKEQYKELTAVPAYYDADFDIRPDASGKAVIKPVSLKFKKAV